MAGVKMSNKGPNSQDAVEAALSVGNTPHVGAGAPNSSANKPSSIGDSINNFSKNLKGDAKEAAKQTANILNNDDLSSEEKVQALKDFASSYDSLNNMMNTAIEAYERDDLKDTSILARAWVTTLEANGLDVTPETAIKQAKGLDAATKQLTKDVRRSGSDVIEQFKTDGVSAALGAATQGLLDTMGEFSAGIGKVTGPIMKIVVQPLVEQGVEKLAPGLGQAIGTGGGALIGGVTDALTKGTGSSKAFGDAGGELGKNVGKVIGDIFAPVVGQVAGDLTESLTEGAQSSVGSLLKDNSQSAGDFVKQHSDTVCKKADNVITQIKEAVPDKPSVNKPS